MVKKPKQPENSAEADMVRLTISLPQSLYDQVQDLARRDDRSLAFVIRKAVEQRVRDEQAMYVSKVQ